MTYFVIRYRDPDKTMRTVVYEYGGRDAKQTARAHHAAWSLERIRKLASTRVVTADGWGELLRENPELFESRQPATA